MPSYWAVMSNLTKQLLSLPSWGHAMGAKVNDNAPALSAAPYTEQATAHSQVTAVCPG